MIEKPQHDCDAAANQEHVYFMHMAIPRINIGLDCSLTALRHCSLCPVQMTDFFYLLIDAPYIIYKEVLMF